jgi:hypothetical protein
MKIPNLLLVAGTGTKAGKTSMICRIIGQFESQNITAIKISPHFHETTTGLVSISEKPGYAIYEETSNEGTKDTARMLNSGASKVYFAKVWDDKLLTVFTEIMKLVPPGSPVICESPALRFFVEPGLFLIMSSDIVNKHKDISNLMALPHVMFKMEELEKIKSIPVGFENGRWVYR